MSFGKDRQHATSPRPSPPRTAERVAPDAAERDMGLMASRNRVWFPGFLWVILLWLMVALSLVPTLRAEDAAANFDAANRLYEEGKFAEAAAAYGRLIDSGAASASVYFNRGNAFFRLGQTGRAIVCYRQAEQLAPRDRELRANLQIARTKARGGTPYAAPRWRSLLGVLTLNEWALLTAAGAWALFIFLALMQWRVDLRAMLQKYAITAGAVVLIAGICLIVKLNADYFVQTAVVVIGETDVRNGPLDESLALFKVRDGAELEILDRKDGWLQVADAAQRTGWVRQDQIVEWDPAKPPGAGKQTGIRTWVD
jgi:tetratricopeptide (TPR) repeat protein